MLLACKVICHAQQVKPILERTLNISFSNERTDVALSKISQAAGFNFSYNPSILDPSKKITFNFKNAPVREILNTIFNGKISFKERKGYLILQPVKYVEKPATQPESFVYSGYVRDEEGQPLPWVSIYDRSSLESTVSNDYGFYRIRFAEKQLPLTLYFSKQGFIDTAVNLVPASPGFINLQLKKRIVVSTPVTDFDSLALSAENTAGSFFTRLNEEPNALNIDDTLYRKYQASVLPYIGTNLKLSGNVINDYSINLFGGIGMGVQKAELAGLFNINKTNVKYVQVAGFFNLNGGATEGVQVAGFTNVVRGDVKGLQIAGFVNLDWSNSEGFLLAGFVNTVKGKSEGLQMAGFVNSTLDSMEGVQVAGFCNVTYRGMKGTQISGGCNVVVDTLIGTQLGLINYAYHIKGSQVGLLNFSKSTNGIPIGMVSYVNDGYHKLELSADEIFPVNLAIRTGVNAFHNIITSGMDPFSGDSLHWNFGYGIGTSIQLSQNTFLDFDVTSSQIVKGNIVDKINLLNKVYLGVDIRLAKKISLATGLTLNGHLYKTNYDFYPEIFSWYEPNIFYNHTWIQDNTRLDMWLGAKVALRFF